GREQRGGGGASVGAPRCVEEGGRGCLVRRRPAEINLGLDETLRVTKCFAGMPAAFIVYEHLIDPPCTQWTNGDSSTVGSAAREVGRPVAAIVERADEVKVLADEHSISTRSLST